MDPDRFQMRDIKRRLTSLEKARVRNEARLGIYRKDIQSLQEAVRILRAIQVALESKK